MQIADGGCGDWNPERYDLDNIRLVRMALKLETKKDGSENSLSVLKDRNSCYVLEDGHANDRSQNHSRMQLSYWFWPRNFAVTVE